MANKINIKVNRIAAIAELQTKLDALNALIAEDAVNQAEHDKKVRDWNTYVMNNVMLGNFEMSTDHAERVVEEWSKDTYRLIVNMKDIKPRPKFESEISWRERDMAKELERTIRLLNMSVDENVSTRVFDSLGNLL